MRVYIIIQLLPLPPPPPSSLLLIPPPPSGLLWWRQSQAGSRRRGRTSPRGPWGGAGARAGAGAGAGVGGSAGQGWPGGRPPLPHLQHQAVSKGGHQASQLRHVEKRWLMLICRQICFAFKVWFFRERTLQDGWWTAAVSGGGQPQLQLAQLLQAILPGLIHPVLLG